MALAAAGVARRWCRGGISPCGQCALVAVSACLVPVARSCVQSVACTMAHYTPKRVVVYMLCDLLRTGLRVLLADMGVDVVAVAQAEPLRRTLHLRTNVELLIVDIYQLTEAV